MQMPRPPGSAYGTGFRVVTRNTLERRQKLHRTSPPFFRRASKAMRGAIMRIHFTTAAKILGATLAALSLFASGYVAGQNKFGQPKTIIHMVILKWRPGVADPDKQPALEGVKEMAAKVPGIKNIWIKADRIQPRAFTPPYAIEFKDRDAADAYAESPLHQEWEQKYYVPIREVSISEQVTNP